jgi:hypothetical protein
MACCTSILPSWHKFRQLPPQDRRSLLQALALLPLTALALRWLGLRRWQTLLARWVPADGPAAESHRREGEAPAEPALAAQALARLVEAAGRYGLCRGTCLQRSLVLWWLLRRRGLDGELRIGVRRVGGRLAAHAWVECGGLALDAPADAREPFVPFDGPILPLPRGVR